MMMYKIKRRRRFKPFVETGLKTALLSVIIFVGGYTLQAGLHEHLVETLVIILVLICFSIIFIPENKF